MWNSHAYVTGAWRQDAYVVPSLRDVAMKIPDQAVLPFQREHGVTAERWCKYDTVCKMSGQHSSVFRIEGQFDFQLKSFVRPLLAPDPHAVPRDVLAGEFHGEKLTDFPSVDDLNLVYVLLEDYGSHQAAWAYRNLTDTVPFMISIFGIEKGLKGPERFHACIEAAYRDGGRRDYKLLMIDPRNLNFGHLQPDAIPVDYVAAGMSPMIEIARSEMETMAESGAERCPPRADLPDLS